MILCGDIGGTKTVLSLYERSGGRWVSRRESVYRSREHGAFEGVLEAFAGEGHPPPDAACFAVAGPVIDGRVTTTNLPWVLDAGDLARQLSLESVHLLNDVEACAYGMLELTPEQRVTLNPPAEPGRRGNRAVVAAGTGMGQAYLIWDGERHRAVATEGGHVDFGPRDDEQIELLRFLRRDFGHVSPERIVSGPGLHNLYRFLRERSGGTAPGWLEARLANEDPGAVIGEVGLEERDAVCARSLELFASILGAVAGDVALRCVALGGVYLGGGIAPRILPVLRAGGFMQAFVDKGRFSELLSGIEVSVALEPKAPLLGAARYAAAPTGS